MATAEQVEMIINLASAKGHKFNDRKRLLALSSNQINSLKASIISMKSKNPSTSEIDPFDTKIQEVPCSFCEAVVGEACWGVVRKRVERKRRQTAHPQRIAAYKKTLEVV